jgi:hypothetical protein
MDGMIRNLQTATRPERNNALTIAVWTLGHWIAAGALEQAQVEPADSLLPVREHGSKVLSDCL